MLYYFVLTFLIFIISVGLWEVYKAVKLYFKLDNTSNYSLENNPKLKVKDFITIKNILMIIPYTVLLCFVLGIIVMLNKRNLFRSMYVYKLVFIPKLTENEYQINILKNWTYSNIDTAYFAKYVTSKIQEELNKE